MLYGCGDTTIPGTGGLVVVGSRNVHEALIEYTENAGRLAAPEVEQCRGGLAGHTGVAVSARVTTPSKRR